MPRYFLEVEYDGTDFKGFQIQENARTVQGEINKALQIRLKIALETVTSSRTDTGVHAYQNFLHFDTTLQLPENLIYNLNAILPASIVIRTIYAVPEDAHSRFDARSRHYRYVITRKKSAFRNHYAWHFPFPLNPDILQNCADQILGQHDFCSFSKKNTDVRNFVCEVFLAKWHHDEHILQFEVQANRFLRGMVRGLVSTMMHTARGKYSLSDFAQLLHQPKIAQADFSAPGCGLFLEAVNYPAELLHSPLLRV